MEATKQRNRTETYWTMGMLADCRVSKFLCNRYSRILVLIHMWHNQSLLRESAEGTCLIFFDSSSDIGVAGKFGSGCFMLTTTSEMKFLFISPLISVSKMR
jgi:hypothetical protein